MKTIKSANHIFKVVDRIPAAHAIWNIGKNMPDGYLPLVQVGGYDGFQVIGTMLALPLKDAQKVLAAIGRGERTITQMEAYIKKYEKSQSNSDERHYKRVAEALEILRTVPGAENLDEYERQIRRMRRL